MITNQTSIATDIQLRNTCFHGSNSEFPVTSLNHASSELTSDVAFCVMPHRLDISYEV